MNKTTKNNDQSKKNDQKKNIVKKNSKLKNEKEKEFSPHDLEGMVKDLDKKQFRHLRSLRTRKAIDKKSKKIILRRLVSMSMVVIFMTIGILYLLGYTYLNYGYGINIVSSSLEGKRISLSENSNFERPTVGLRADALDEMDNITYSWLDLDELNTDIGGTKNGDNYIHYTFYLRNSGVEDLDYNKKLSIIHSTKDVEEAIRIKLYENGEPIVYTHTYEENIDPEIEDSGVPVEEFNADDDILNEDKSLPVGEYNKYTIVMWLEGHDPDCTDDKLDGELRLKWDFSVIE